MNPDKQRKQEVDALDGWEIEIRPPGKPPIVLKPKSPTRTRALSDEVCGQYAELLDKLALDVAEATLKGDAKAAANAEEWFDKAAAIWDKGDCRRLS